MTRHDYYMTQTKHPFKSKTFWLNLLGIIAGFTLFVIGEVEAGATLTVPSVLNMFLRFITKQEIKF